MKTYWAPEKDKCNSFFPSRGVDEFDHFPRPLLNETIQ